MNACCFFCYVKSDALQMGASQFEQSAGSLKRKMAWQNMKMMILMGVVGTIMGAVVICKTILLIKLFLKSILKI